MHHIVLFGKRLWTFLNENYAINEKEKHWTSEGEQLSLSVANENAIRHLFT